MCCFPSLASIFLIQEEAVHKKSKRRNYICKFQLQIHSSGQESHPPRWKSSVSEGHVFLWCLFVSEIEEEDAGQGANQENDVEPAVVEVELQLSQNLCHNGAIFQWHAHTHQQDR